MTDTEKLKRELVALCLLDIDAAMAYEQAIPRIDHPVVRERYVEFLGDHNRHILDLSQQIMDLGEAPPQRGADFKGFFISAFTDLRSSEGIRGALSAMELNEKLVNRIYGRALRWPDLVPNALNLVKTNYLDEKKHLEFIEESLEARVWDRREAVK